MPGRPRGRKVTRTVRVPCTATISVMKTVTVVVRGKPRRIQQAQSVRCPTCGGAGYTTRTYVSYE